jgi:hypothetical protein
VNLQDGKSYRGRRAVFVRAGPSGDEGGNELDHFRMAASQQAGYVYVTSDTGLAGWNRYPVPAEALADFEAGGDPARLIDYLLETYPELDWVNTALRHS